MLAVALLALAAPPKMPVLVNTPQPAVLDNARPDLIGGEQHVPTTSPLTPVTNMDAPAAPRRVFAVAQIVRALSTPRSVDLAPDALLIEEAAHIRPIQLISDRPVSLPGWLGGSVPANAAYVLQRSVAGKSACLTKTEEPRTADGVHVPVCLFDSDDDRLYDRLIVGTDDPVAVEPLTLAPLDATLPSRVNYPKITFQFWISSITATTAHIECGADVSVGGGQRRYIARFMKVRSPGLCQFELPLREGATVSYRGATFTAKSIDGGWRIATSGQVDWITLGNGGTLIDAHVIQLEMI